MAKDELTRPLGLTPRATPSPRRRLAIVATVAALLIMGGAAGGAFWFMRIPVAPGPTATVTIAAAASKLSDLPAPTAAVTPRPAPQPPPQTPVVTGGPGLTELKPTGSLTDIGKVVIYDPTAPQPISLPATPDTALVENGGYGPLPKVAANGRRPLDAYARPAQSDGGTRIAIVVGGVGLDPATTHDAVALPGGITLALAPYATNMTQTLADARRSGHELLLQIPLEPYGYPKTDPGPHTLTTAATVKANLDDLSWLLSRATNYVGVVNYMGARFTTEPQAMASLLDALGKRGLLYLDDGSSPRSLAADAAAAGRTPFLKADMVLDPDLTGAAIDARLDQLVALARSHGQAVATATAFPVTLERLAAFAKTVAAKDVTLVPVSALLAPPRT